MPYNPGVQDRSGEILAQGISQGFSSLTSGIQKRQNILSEARGRGRALRSTIKGLESLNILPTGMSDDLTRAEENSSPTDFLATVNEMSDKLNGLITAGTAAQQIQARKEERDAALANDKRIQQNMARLYDPVLGSSAAEKAIMGGAGFGRPENPIPSGPKAFEQLAPGTGEMYRRIPAIGASPSETAALMNAVTNRVREEGAGGTTDTSQQKNTAATIRAELDAGILKPADVAARRAQLQAAGGQDPSTSYPSDGTYVDRVTGKNPINAVRKSSTGQVGTVDDKGVFTVLDLKTYKPSTLGDASSYLPDALMMKLSEDLTTQEREIKAINRYAQGVEGIPTGLAKLPTKLSLIIKTLTDKPYTESEKQLGVAGARQQRLLGALKNQILGPGVLTETDAKRVIDAVGGDIESVFTNPQIVSEVLSEIVEEKMAGYSSNLRIYNRNVAGKYSESYEQKDAVKAYKPITKTDAENAAAMPPVSAMTDAQLAARRAELFKKTQSK